MKKVLLLNPPAKDLILRHNYSSYTSKAGYYWPSTDLLVLSGVLSGHFDLYMIDAIVQRISARDCLKMVKEIGPDAVIFVSGTASWKGDFEFISELKKYFSPLILISSGMMLKNGSQIMQDNNFLDATILNFVDSSVVDYIKEGKGGVNLLWRENGKIFGNEVISCTENFSYVIPRHELFPLRRYKMPLLKRKPFTCITASFGCPFKCSFCIDSILGYQKRSVKNILDELQYIKELGIKEVMFSDATFTANKKHVLEICEGMHKLSLDLAWSCNVHASTIDKELVRGMKEAGCHLVGIGIESGSEDILIEYSKSTTKEKIRQAISICKSLKVETLGYFIIGLPGEDKSKILSTIKFGLELDPTLASFSIATPDIGTKLWEDCLSRRLISTEYQEFDSSKTSVIKLKEVSPEDVIHFKNMAYLKFYLRPNKIFNLFRFFLKRNNISDFFEFSIGFLKNIFFT